MDGFNFASAPLVLAGTLYGEARGTGRSGMENVAQCVLNRVADRWPGGGGITGVCLAYEQFSCWNAADPNRAKIIAAAASGDPSWRLALDVAHAAIGGVNPDRIMGADSYYARSMPHPAFWAKLPATFCWQDAWHSFWSVRGAHRAPNVSVMSAADLLNAAELARTAGGA